MKKIFFTILSIGMSMVSLAQGEWVNASIGNGGSTNKADLFIQTTTTFDANKCDNLVFTVRVPIAGGANVVLTETFHSPAFAHISFQIVKYPVNDGVYYYYLINGTGNVQSPLGTNIVGGGPSFRVLEITFSGGTNAFVELANIENDIPGNNGTLIRPQFYTQINIGDITNYSAMFYGTAGAVAHNNANANGDDWVPTSGNVVLPIKWLSFDVVKQGNNALLNWSVANEATNHHYEILRSSDGVNYTTIGTVNKSTTGSTTYNYTDIGVNSLNAAIVYYRIRQVDVDGKSTYSDIRYITIDKKPSDIITIFPNPVTEGFYISIPFKNRDNSIVKLKLINASGQFIGSKEITTTQASNYYFNIKDKALASGDYYLEIIYEEKIIGTKKLYVNK